MSREYLIAEISYPSTQNKTDNLQSLDVGNKKRKIT